MLTLPQIVLADARKGEIQRDAEHYMLLAQHAEKVVQEHRLAIQQAEPVAGKARACWCPMADA